VIDIVSASLSYQLPQPPDEPIRGVGLRTVRGEEGRSGGDGAPPALRPQRATHLQALRATLHRERHELAFVRAACLPAVVLSAGAHILAPLDLEARGVERLTIDRQDSIADLQARAAEAAVPRDPHDPMAERLGVRLLGGFQAGGDILADLLDHHRLAIAWAWALVEVSRAAYHSVT
jgi:hypothetical protein